MKRKTCYVYVNSLPSACNCKQRRACKQRSSFHQRGCWSQDPCLCRQDKPTCISMRAELLGWGPTLVSSNPVSRQPDSSPFRVRGAGTYLSGGRQKTVLAERSVQQRAVRALFAAKAQAGAMLSRACLFEHFLPSCVRRVQPHASCRAG